MLITLLGTTNEPTQRQAAKALANLGVNGGCQLGSVSALPLPSRVQTCRRRRVSVVGEGTYKAPSVDVAFHWLGSQRSPCAAPFDRSFTAVVASGRPYRSQG